MSSRDLRDLRSKIERMSTDITRCAGGNVLQSELSRQVLGALSFGALFAVGQEERLTPPEVHALAIAMLQDAFGYNDQSAVGFAEDLIRNTSPQPENPTMNAIIHRGIDVHMLWSKNRASEYEELVRDTLRGVRVPNQ